MSLQHGQNDFRNNLRHVAKQDPEECPCMGHGWILSGFDTFHKCPNHFAQQRHPESPEYAFAEVTEFKKVVDKELVPVYRVAVVIGNDFEEEEVSYLHFKEFDDKEVAKKFGDRVAARDDISSRVQNENLWECFSEAGPEDRG